MNNFYSTLQTRYLGFCFLWMEHTLLLLMKWQQQCPELRLLLTEDYNNALIMWWLRSVVECLTAYSKITLSLVIKRVLCWVIRLMGAMYLHNYPCKDKWVIWFGVPWSWCYKVLRHIILYCPLQTPVQVERLLSSEQKATDYRSPDDGIAPDYRATNACTR